MSGKNFGVGSYCITLNPQAKDQKISKALKINFMQRFAV
jgi:hypothetical protein